MSIPLKIGLIVQVLISENTHRAGDFCTIRQTGLMDHTGEYYSQVQFSDGAYWWFRTTSLKSLPDGKITNAFPVTEFKLTN